MTSNLYTEFCCIFHGTTLFFPLLIFFLVITPVAPHCVHTAVSVDKTFLWHSAGERGTCWVFDSAAFIFNGACFQRRVVPQLFQRDKMGVALMNFFVAARILCRKCECKLKRVEPVLSGFAHPNCCRVPLMSELVGRYTQVFQRCATTVRRSPQ